MGTTCAIVICGRMGYVNIFLTSLYKAFPYIVVEHEWEEKQEEEEKEVRYFGKFLFGKDINPEQLEAFAQRPDHEVQVGMCECTSKK